MHATQIGTVKDLARRMELIPATEGLRQVTFLIGAGCSLSAGIPTVNRIAQTEVQKLAEHLGLGQHDNPSVALALLGEKKGYFTGHLDIARKHDPALVNWGQVYDVLFKDIYSSPYEVAKVFKDLIRNSSPKINWAHLSLGELAANNWIATTITTNFDLLALEGYARAGVIPVVSDGIESLDRIDPRPGTPQLLQINGSIHSYRLRNGADDLDGVQNSPAAISCFRSLYQNSAVFVVVGYAGREPQIMQLLEASAESFPDHHVFWCLYSSNPEDLSQNARDFLSHSKNARLIIGQDADRFFFDLCAELGVQSPLSLRDPVAFQQRRLDGIFSPGTGSQLEPITQEIEEAHRILSALRDCSNPAPEKAIGRKARQPRPKSAKSDETTEPKTGDLTASETEPKDFSARRASFLELLEAGRERGDAGKLRDAISLAREMIDIAKNPDERGTALDDLGNALRTLGDREVDSARLEQAVAAFRAALEERTRDRVPLDWAATQNNLGNALFSLGEREAGTERLEQAVAAYRDALEERTRDRVPLEWAMTQNNLGTALATLGEREAGTARLEEAATAFRAALEERTRDRRPLDWAGTQNNLGNALSALGQREAGIARLEQAVTAYRAALEERTRDRVPLGWAGTQFNLAHLALALHAKTNDPAHLRQAREAAVLAREVFAESSHHQTALCDRLLARIAALDSGEDPPPPP
jgi:tetratricopeptide (TPR) repeat protein